MFSKRLGTKIRWSLKDWAQSGQFPSSPQELHMFHTKKSSTFKFLQLWCSFVCVTIQTITMHLQLEKSWRSADPEVSFVSLQIFLLVWAVICLVVPPGSLCGGHLFDMMMSLWASVDVHCLWVWIKMLIWWSIALRSFQHSLWSQSYNFPKEFRFFYLPRLWTWRISPWFLDISRYQCWQPKKDKTSGLWKSFWEFLFWFSDICNGSAMGTIIYYFVPQFS